MRRRRFYGFASLVLGLWGFLVISIDVSREVGTGAGAEDFMLGAMVGLFLVSTAIAKIGMILDVHIEFTNIASICAWSLAQALVFQKDGYLPFLRGWAEPVYFFPFVLQPAVDLFDLVVTRRRIGIRAREKSQSGY